MFWAILILLYPGLCHEFPDSLQKVETDLNKDSLWTTYILMFKGCLYVCDLSKNLTKLLWRSGCYQVWVPCEWWPQGGADRIIVGATCQPQYSRLATPLGTYQWTWLKPAKRVSNPYLHSQKVQGQLGCTYLSSQIGLTHLKPIQNIRGVILSMSSAVFFDVWGVARI